jgi:5-methylcytosine-specific restriction enzyme B
MYALFRPNENSEITKQALKAFLDLAFAERDEQPLSAHHADANLIQTKWLSHLMPELGQQRVRDLLEDRRFLIVQGPPGTGKTRMALKLLKEDYSSFGHSIQFHPNTSYEAFVGGLAPITSIGNTGLQFTPVMGSLMMAAKAARDNPKKPYLLHIDEINRADLSKILGEAIYLFEPNEVEDRTIRLQYDFGSPYHGEFTLPKNLHVLGTMNTADRSIAIVDVAVRRRFGFVSLWPQMSVVAEHGGALMQEAFKKLVSIFLEYASDDAFNLIPGHSYFIEKDDKKSRERLKITLAPLLEEYLAQGYVGGFAEPVRGYIQWLRSLWKCPQYGGAEAPHLRKYLR